MTNTYRFADVNVEVTAVHPFIHSFCRDYLVSEPADFSVETTRADIEFERSKAEHSDASDAYLESLAVYRKIAEKMPHFGAFLMHGSAIAVDGRGYIFTAASGTGKSTHARLWRELLGDKAIVINDDKPLLRIRSDGSAVVYGTPWDGKHRLSRNISVPLKAVCFLKRAEKNTIREILRQTALPAMIGHVYRPADANALSETLVLLDKMNARFYSLGCNMDISAAKLAYEAMGDNENEA